MEQQVIKQFIDANEKRLETYNKMRKVYLAARELGMTKREISKIFNDRGAGDLLKYIAKGRFKPFDISDKMKNKYRELAKEKGIPNPLDRRAIREISRIRKRLFRQRLNKEFIIDRDRYTSVPTTLPNTAVVQSPMPVVPKQTAQVIPQTGLTQTETALLSPTEQIIRQRTRT